MTSSTAALSMHKNQRNLSMLLVLTAALMWATIGPIAALLPDGSGVGIAAWRQIFGSVVLLLVVSFSKTGWSRWTRSDLKATVIGSVTVAAYSAMYFPSVQLVGVAIATVVSIGGAPLFAGLLHLYRARHITTNWLIGTLIATIGMALVILPGTQTTANFIGLVLAIASAVIYAFQAQAISDLAQKHSPTETIAVLFTLSAIILTPAAGTSFELVSANQTHLWLLIFMGVFSTSIAYSVFAAGARNIGSHTAVTLTLVEPVAAAALAAALANEIPSSLQWFGMIVAIVGLAIVIKYDKA